MKKSGKYCPRHCNLRIHKTHSRTHTHTKRKTMKLPAACLHYTARYGKLFCFFDTKIVLCFVGTMNSFCDGLRSAFQKSLTWINCLRSSRKNALFSIISSSEFVYSTFNIFIWCLFFVVHTREEEKYSRSCFHALFRTAHWSLWTEKITALFY